MYLPADFLRDLLVRHDLFQHGDRLFVSNEYGQSKFTGSLWPTIITEMGVPAEAIHHTGNDARSDHRSAQKAGLSTTLLGHCNLNRFEEELEQWAFETDGFTSLLAGASRLARINVNASTEHERLLRDVSAGVVAPFVVGNVLWILRRAVEDGLKKVFFIARDGQVLLDVARELAPMVGFTGELEYLYGSRQAWMLPSMTEITTDVLDTIVPFSGDVDMVTLRLIAHRFEIEPESIRDELIAADFAENSWDSAMDASGCAGLQELLRSNEHVQRVMLDVASERRRVFLKYLEQVGVLTDEPIGIVDQGTGGTLYNALSSVLETVGQRPPHAFYFGVRSDSRDQGYGFPEAYVRNEQHGTGFLSTPGLLTMVEMACTADHGSVIGYRETSDGVEAELCEQQNRAVVDWGFAVVRETVGHVARELRLDHSSESINTDLRSASLGVFDAFWMNPTRAEAAAWGSYPFEDGWGTDSVSLPLAHRQGVRAVVQSQPHRHWWKAGARALSTPLPRALLRSREDAIVVLRKARARLS